MNKKGFTLVEVLVVIAIIALLVFILVPNVFTMINKNNEKSCNNIINNIKSSAKLYITYNKYDLGIKCYDQNNVEDTTTTINLQKLIDTGNLTTDSTGMIINPIDKKEFSLENSKVSITYNCSTKEFTYNVEAVDIEGNIIACTK